MRQTPSVTPVAPDVETGVEFVYDATAEFDPPHDVIIHNDDVTPFEFVTRVLQAVFDLLPDDALRVTLTAHERGQAYVATLPFEDAKYRVYRAHRLARARSYPLTFTLQPAH